jgi:type IV secretory pathway VirB6-like protein
VKKLYLYSLLIVLFVLSGCSCGTDAVTGDTDNYITYNSSVNIFADGCSDINGSTSMSQTGNSSTSSVYSPTGECDDYYGGSGSWANRGRWIKVPGDASSVLNGDNFSVTVHGNINYCSYGYDNKNPSPLITAVPNNSMQTWFEYDSTLYSEGELPAPTQLPVQAGQLIVLEISQTPLTTGISLAKASDNITDICADTDYDGFVAGTCRGINGFGLTIYVGDDNSGYKEVVTLDNKASSDSTYTAATSRYPDMFKPLISTRYYDDATQTWVTTTYDNALENFDEWVFDKYGVESISTIGPGKYVFKVPEDMNGVLGFSIAQGTVFSSEAVNDYDGYYTINVLSAHPGCHVRDSVVSDLGSRGAMQILLVEPGLNPNIEDTTTEFPDNTTTITEYYPELLKFISQNAGITIESDAAVLGDLAAYSEYEQTLILVDSQEYSGRAPGTGDLWLKVRDDYYHDNVGQYQADVEVTTKKQTLVSSFLADISDPIIDSLNTTTKIIYDSFSTSSNWTNIMQMSLFLYIIIYGAGFILGIAQTSANDMVIRVIKIGVVTVLFEPNSWDFFNTYFFKLFTDGKDYLISAVTGDTSSDLSGVFGFIDDMFYTFFSQYTWEKLAALVPYLIGIVYIFIFLTTMVLYMVAMSQVFIVYLLTIIGISLLLSIAPLFMVTLLFERTRTIFLNWVKYLADYAMQPVILFATLYVMNEIFMTFWNTALDIDIRYGGVWELDFFGVDGWTYGWIPSFSFGCVQFWYIDGGLDVYSMFVSVLILYIFVYTIQAILAHIPQLTEHLMSTSTASSTFGTAGKIMQQAVNFAQGGDPVAKMNYRKGLEERAKKEEKDKEKGDSIRGRGKDVPDDGKNKQKPDEDKEEMK